MRTPRFSILASVSILLLALCSCGPFGAGPWYAIYQGTQKDDDDAGTVRITYGPEVSSLTNTSATIEWVTDVKSDSTVRYGLDTAYGSQGKDAALDTVHSVTLSSLTSDTTYHFKVLSVSGTGANGTSADCEFATKVSLTITSACGPTTPAAGTWYYDSGDDVFATAPDNVSGPAKTRYRCAGWSGTGSAPLSGTETSVFFTIGQDSTLTWNWVTQYYLTTSSSPIGSGTVECSPLGNWHDDGSAPEITATGNAGYAFVQWTGAVSSSNNPETLAINAPETVIANFTGETFTLTVNSLYGSPDPVTGPHLCASGASIDASVNTPVSGGTGTRYVCTGWTGTGDVDPTGTTSSTNFIITQDSSITWTWKTQYQLATVINPVGAGDVQRSPDATWYDSATVVQLTATENPSFTFNDWTGDLVSVINPDNITMDSAKTVTANYTSVATLYTLTVASTYGTPDPPTSSVAEGTTVTATVDSTVDASTTGMRYACTGWTGTGDVDPTGTTNSTIFTMTQDSSITWNWKTQYQLTTSVTPVGGGSVERSPDDTWYDDATVVQLTANPSASYVFDSWSEDLTGSTNPDNITMDGPKSVTATFTTTTYTLTVVSDHGTPDPPDGSEFTSGTNVTATVDATVAASTPGVRYLCTGWVGSGSVPATGLTNSANFDITEDSSITWQWQMQYELAAAAAPPAGGTVQLTPSGGWYDPSTEVEVMAVAASSYDFTTWSSDLTGSTNPEKLVMDGPKSVTANFELQTSVIRVPDDYGTIQEAIDACSIGGTVLVSDGTWQGTGNKNLDYFGKAITVKSENGPDNCIIDCQNSGRGFHFHSGEGPDSILDGFTIKNGSISTSGGGVRCVSSSSPTITNCIIRDCAAVSYGGGIFCDHANPAISDCEILDNTAKYGGGIHVLYCTSVISNCVISGNTAENYGGGIDCYISTGKPKVYNCVIINNIVTSTTLGYGGGGVASRYNAAPEFMNCLIVSNDSGYYGGGVYCNDAECTLTNCTIAGNSSGRGGGIVSIDSTPELRNCVIWYNDATVTANEMLVSVSTLTADYCDFRDGIGNVSGTVTETNCIHSDPMFASLAGENFRPLLDSPCINSGDNIYVGAGDKDLDGRDRIIDTTVDMGCYEFNALNVPSVYSTIQDAIDAAGTGDTVVVADGTYQGVSNKDLDFGGKLIVVCSENGPAGCIIDCETIGRGFYFHSGEGLGSVVAGFTIRNGNINPGGGIRCYNSSPTIRNCAITNNSSSLGGGIYCSSASPTLANCTVANNSAGTYGGGIYCGNASPSITNCIMVDNSSGRGGAISCWSASSPTIRNCIITDNQADDYGGGIYCNSSSPAITNCLVAANSAVSYGGGIYCDDATPTITNCTVADNPAKWGGGIYCCVGSTATLTNTMVWGNSATSGGNQIYVNSGNTVTLDYCDYADGSGDVEGSGTVTPDANCIYTDPLFVTGPVGDYYLSQIAAGQGSDSPCVDAGSDTAANLGLDNKTTRTDTVTDTGTVDMGYHYDP